MLADLTSRNEDRLYNKVIWRMVPFLFVFYVLGYLDRVNIGFAKLQMLAYLGWSDSVYGLGAGMFFFGYLLLQVPGNIIMVRIGARRWIATIMVIWGLISASMMFVHTPLFFYILRFSLGLAEAGFFPGIVLYLTFWFPSQRRGKVVAMFMSAIAVAGIVGGPVSGWIMHSFDQVGGLKGWQWLFVMEGLPTVALGGLVLVILDDSIQQARWLTDDEKAVLALNIANEKRTHHQYNLGEVLTNAGVWLLCVVDFLINIGIFTVGFWLPQIIKDTGVSDPLHIGLLSAIPYGIAVVVMITVSMNSDRIPERRWHLAVSFFTGAIGLVGCGLAGHSTLWSMLALTVATCGILTCFPIFWTLPSEFLSGIAVAAAIGLINSTGNLGGFFSPYIIGIIKDATHSTAPGLYVIAAGLALGGIIVLVRKQTLAASPLAETVPA
jgi:D-galactonate transporter